MHKIFQVVVGGANFNTRGRYICKVQQIVGFSTKSCSKILTAVWLPFHIWTSPYGLKLDNRGMYFALEFKMSPTVTCLVCGA